MFLIELDVCLANLVGYKNLSSTYGGVLVFRVVSKVNISEVSNPVLKYLVNRDIKYLNIASIAR